jgi:hypothetical protein
MGYGTIEKRNAQTIASLLTFEQLASLLTFEQLVVGNIYWAHVQNNTNLIGSLSVNQENAYSEFISPANHTNSYSSKQ